MEHAWVTGNLLLGSVHGCLEPLLLMACGWSGRACNDQYLKPVYLLFLQWFMVRWWIIDSWLNLKGITLGQVMFSCTGIDPLIDGTNWILMRLFVQIHRKGGAGFLIRLGDGACLIAGCKYIEKGGRKYNEAIVVFEGLNLQQVKASNFELRWMIWLLLEQWTNKKDLHGIF